ncbi:hypothetical protein [Streptomyces sp. Isolate_45]|nr:hypothetical protein [Streptomyces sp. Isolate_45]MDA5285528.1 hypothetical protein [Streptomyces sp. Isolate_45]
MKRRLAERLHELKPFELAVMGVLWLVLEIVSAVLAKLVDTLW